jgi:hypothetical protein
MVQFSRRFLRFALLFIVCLSLRPLLGQPVPAPPPVIENKRLTLTAEKQPLTKVLEALSRATGVKIVSRLGEANPNITVRVKDVSFWDGLDAVADAAQARIEPGTDALYLLADENNSRRWVRRDGPFRSSVKRVTVSRDLDSNNGKCNVTLEVAWVPTLLPILVESAPQEVRVLDEAREEIPVPFEASNWVAVEGRPNYRTSLSFPAPPRKATKLGLIEGKLSAMVPTKMLTFTFDSLAQLEKPMNLNVRSLTLENVTCRITDVKLTRDHWTVGVHLRYPTPLPSLESFNARAWGANNEIALVSTAGKPRLTTTNWYSGGESSTNLTMSYTFHFPPGSPPGNPADWRVNYRAPANIVKVPLAFSFKDVPLP